MPLKKLMTDHPNSVGETYFSHMAFALVMAGRMALAAGALLVHAFLPFLFVTAGIRLLARMNHAIQHRGASNEETRNVPVGSLQRQ
ncbi:MAG: DUF6356 family protein [Pseudomonadota bacterium]